MFEELEQRARSAAEMRAARRRAEIAAQLAAELPHDVRVEAGKDGVRISGRALKRRFALDPLLRALAGGIW